MFDSLSIAALQHAIGITEANAAITKQLDGGTEPIPTTIYFDCVPYHGLERRQFVLRLGVLTSGDKPAITPRIVQEELHSEEMAIEFAHLTRDALGGVMPVLVGAYSKTA